LIAALIGRGLTGGRSLLSGDLLLSGANGVGVLLGEAS
jgi:hypothetical protein